MVTKIKTKPKSLESLKKALKDRKGISRIGSFFSRKRQDNLSQNSTEKSNYQDFVDGPVPLLKKDDACELRAPVKVEMEHLLDFLEVDLESLIRPDIKLSYCFNDKWQDKCYINALAMFFDYLYWHDLSLQDFLEKNDALEEKCSGFVDFCKKKIDLFEKFFPLPKKYRIFAEELLKIIYEDKNTSANGKDNFMSKYCAFVKVLKEAYETYCDDPKKQDVVLFKPRSEELLFFFTGTKSPSPQQIKIYQSFENKLLALLKDIKNQNISEDTKKIKDKIEFLAKSTFNKSSTNDKKSFLCAIKEETNRCLCFDKLNMKQVKNLWVGIKEQIIQHHTFTEPSNISIDDSVISEQYIPATLDFLGSVIEERKDFLLGKWDSAKLPNDSKIRQGLVAVAMTSLAEHDYGEFAFFFPAEKTTNNTINLRHSFSQLTKKERMAVMCTEVKCGTKSFPLLPLLLLNSRFTPILMNIVEDFVPEVFGIKFQLNEEGKKCDIIELLEEINDFYAKKRAEKYIKNDSCVSMDLCRSINCLKKTKKELDSQNNKIQAHQAPQALDEKPSTLIHQTEKEKVKRVSEHIFAL